MSDLFDFVEMTRNSFYIVVEKDNNVKAAYICVKAAFDNVASTLLLAWSSCNSCKPGDELAVV